MSSPDYYDLHNIQNVSLESINFYTNGSDKNPGEDFGIITINQNGIFMSPIDNNKSISIGHSSGGGNVDNTVSTQSQNCIAIGNFAGKINQGNVIGNSVAIGISSGENNQKNEAVAIGNAAGQSNQGANCVAIGYNAGNTGQGDNAVSIGNFAGRINQQTEAVAIGNSAGQNFQGEQSIAIGELAGQTSQGIASIAIGLQAGKSNQHDNSIILNSQGAELNSTRSNAFYVAPLNDTLEAGATGVMIYNNDTKEITYSTAKTFVINHPRATDKYLVHSCLEGPEAGIYYRGKAEIENEYVEVSLPDYVASFGFDFTIQLTNIYKNGCNNTRVLSCSEVDDGKFKVYGEPGPFYWLVHASRGYINVEPMKADVEVKGDGPYKYI